MNLCMPLQRNPINWWRLRDSNSQRMACKASRFPDYAQVPFVWYPVKELTLRLCFVGAALNPSANRALFGDGYRIRTDVPFRDREVLWPLS